MTFNKNVNPLTNCIKLNRSGYNIVLLKTVFKRDFLQWGRGVKHFYTSKIQNNAPIKDTYK